MRHNNWSPWTVWAAQYNAVLFRFYKRASNGLTRFNLNYTYSHNLNTSQVNAGGPQIYGENASDFPNHNSPSPLLLSTAVRARQGSSSAAFRSGGVMQS